MFNVGTPELLVILLVALLVLGPTKLPEAARKVGQAVGEFRKLSTGFQAELRDALKEPVDEAPAGPSRATTDPGVSTGQRTGADEEATPSGDGAAGTTATVEAEAPPAEGEATTDVGSSTAMPVSAPTTDGTSVVEPGAQPGDESDGSRPGVPSD